MALRILTFPTSSHKTDVHIQLQQVGAAVISDARDEFNIEISKLGKLVYNLEPDPANLTMRAGSIDIRFIDVSNNMESIFGLFPTDTPIDLFIKISVDGEIFFDGILDREKIKKSNWFVNEFGVLQYREITFHFDDKIFLLKNFLTEDIPNIRQTGSLANISQSLKEHIEEYATFLTMSSFVNDTWGIHEQNGHNYAINSGSFASGTGSADEVRDVIRVQNVKGNLNALENLQRHGYAFCSFIYTQKGKLFFLDRISRKTGSLNFDDIIKIEPKLRTSIFDIIEVKKREAFFPLQEEGGGSGDKYITTVKVTFTKETFTTTTTQRKFSLDLSGDYKEINLPNTTPVGTGRYFVTQSALASASVYPEGINGDLADDTGSNNLTYNADGFHLTGSIDSPFIEQGQFINYNLNAGGSPITFRMIAAVPTNDRIWWFSDTGSEVLEEADITEGFQVFRFSAVGQDLGLRRLYKTGWVVAIAADKYFTWFDSSDSLKIKIPGLHLISGSLNLNNLNYCPAIIEYDFIPDTTDLTMPPVGNQTGSFGLPDWQNVIRLYPTESLATS